ncbi:hypothetical protein Ae201684P_005477 [Aphanomyces euteiches]|uniref:Uncharacterized protein n=1 Tax=Aphanomyces euteiches TaxID=100861 RepID=A0A6G0X4C8_9STRA|nr:hypothetical protein Ae201684_008578 [Aphanomyces euteiches]KAH9085776.1 hypothetical protein Ae201684P_005477 [Aphanomyces euteiches]
MHTVVPYFWVDFDRRFEIAHTAQRHLRCAVHRKEKAAVDLETLLRNVNSKDLTQSSFGIQTNPTIFMPLMLLDSGPDASALMFENEVALWQQAGLTHYSIHFLNQFVYAAENSVTIVNSLNFGQSVKVFSMSYADLTSVRWTM